MVKVSQLLILIYNNISKLILTVTVYFINKIQGKSQCNYL